MNSLTIPLACLTALVLAAVAFSFIVLHYASSTARAAGRRAHALEDQLSEARRSTEANLQALTEQLRDFEHQQGAVISGPSLPRSGFNLGKRTQALRLHRRGDSPEQIAEALGIPVQEVQLLVKVHHIVLRQIGA